VSDDLRNLVHSPGCKLFVGIGNVLKSDDGIGVYLAQGIHEKDKIKALMDALDFRQKPGYFRLLTPDEIMDYTATTHNLSISKLHGFFKPPVLILGIQPQSVSFGENIAKPVKKQADSILKIINSI
jgi:Ni,Fe-hydrogenase maturation factor